MDYLKIYNNIINKAILENRTKKDNYFEKHHIKPKCIGGDNSKENLVLLTAREHFICHKLLTLIYPNSDKLHFAFWAMCNQTNGDLKRNYTISSRVYNEAKEQFAIINSRLHKGKKISEEQKESVRLRMLTNNPLKGKKGVNNHNYGKPRSNDIKNKISHTKTSNPTKNANFKGIYITPLGEFFSSKEASLIHGLDNTVIIDRCKKKSNFIITPKSINRSKDLTYNDIGKTYRELGWYFIPQTQK